MKKDNKRSKVDEFTLVKINNNIESDYGVILKEISDINGNVSYISLRLSSERKSANKFTRISTVTGGVYFVIDGADDLVLLTSEDFVTVCDLFTMCSVTYIRQLVRDKLRLYELDNTSGNIYNSLSSIVDNIPKLINEYDRLVCNVSNVFGSLDSFEEYVSNTTEETFNNITNEDIEEEEDMITIKELSEELLIEEEAIINFIVNDPDHSIDPQYTYTNQYKLNAKLESEVREYFNIINNRIEKADGGDSVMRLVETDNKDVESKETFTLEEMGDLISKVKGFIEDPVNPIIPESDSEGRMIDMLIDLCDYHTDITIDDYVDSVKSFVYAGETLKDAHISDEERDLEGNVRVLRRLKKLFEIKDAVVDKLTDISIDDEISSPVEDEKDHHPERTTIIDEMSTEWDDAAQEPETACSEMIHVDHQSEVNSETIAFRTIKKGHSVCVEDAFIDQDVFEILKKHFSTYKLETLYDAISGSVFKSDIDQQALAVYRLIIAGPGIISSDMDDIINELYNENKDYVATAYYAIHSIIEKYENIYANIKNVMFNISKWSDDDITQLVRLDITPDNIQEICKAYGISENDIQLYLSGCFMYESLLQNR